MSSILIELLKEFNLTEKEISIYHYLLQVGHQPASVIAKNLNVQRSSCYAHLQKLLELNLVVQIIRNNITFYSAAPASTVLAKFKQKKETFDLKIKQAEAEIAAFKFLPNGFHNKAKAHYFSGNNGIVQILENILIEKPRQLKAFISNNLNEFLDQHYPDFAQKRAGQGTSAQAIHPMGNNLSGNWTSNTATNRVSKSISPVFDRGMDVLVYDNKTTLISTTEEFGLTIESDVISNFQNRLFDIVWRFAKAA